MSTEQQVERERDGSRGISDEKDGEACRKKLRLSNDQSAISATSNRSLITNKAPPSRCWMVVPTLSSHRLNLHQLLLAQCCISCVQARCSSSVMTLLCSLLHSFGEANPSPSLAIRIHILLILYLGHESHRNLFTFSQLSPDHCMLPPSWFFLHGCSKSKLFHGYSKSKPFHGRLVVFLPPLKKQRPRATP
ncbi:hypothetical protein ACFX2J_034976 [Malus domestica]